MSPSGRRRGSPTGRWRAAEFHRARSKYLNLIAAGKSNKEIAGLLFVSEGTVKTHVLNIHKKLGVTDRTEAVVVAIRRGILRV